MATKGASYIQMFQGLSPLLARRLEGVELPNPEVVYDDSYDLDLGGRVVHLQAMGQAHTKGDQVVTVPDAGVMFTGDLAETGQFAIFPWFPPYDVDVSGLGWIKVMGHLINERPQVVVPGHGDIGGPERLADVHQYLEDLRDETGGDAIGDGRAHDHRGGASADARTAPELGRAGMDRAWCPVPLHGARGVTELFSTGKATT